MKKALLLAILSGAALMAGSASASDTKTYRYDAKGRLVKVTSTGTVNNGRVESICHDKADNRTTVKSNGVGTAASCTSPSA